MNPSVSLLLANAGPAHTLEKRKRPELPAEIAARYADTVEIRRDLPAAGTTNPHQMVDVYLPKKRTTDKPLPVVLVALLGTSGNVTTLDGNLGPFTNLSTYITKDTPPILTIHGKHDSLVAFQQSLRLDAGLKQADAASWLVPLAGVDHNFAAGSETQRRIRQFLDLHLRGIQAEISTTPIPRAEAIVQ